MANTKTRYDGPTGFLSEPEAEEAVNHSKVDLTNYTAAVRQSQTQKARGEKPAVGVTVPVDAVSYHESNFRRAADGLNTGLKVKTTKHGDTGFEKFNLQPGQARIVIEAKDRKVFTPEQLAERKAKMRATRAANKAKTEAKLDINTSDETPQPRVQPRKGGLLSRS